MARLIFPLIVVFAFNAAAHSGYLPKSVGKTTYLKDVEDTDMPRIIACYRQLANLPNNEDSFSILLEDLRHLWVKFEGKLVEKVHQDLMLVENDIGWKWYRACELSKRKRKAIDGNPDLTSEQKQEEHRLLQAHREENFNMVALAAKQAARDGWTVKIDTAKGK